MATAVFRFARELERFLAPDKRGGRFRHDCARAASLKNAIEALGVPHTEVGALTVNGAAATLQRTVREGDEVVVEPRSADAVVGDEARFLADAHLGGLARLLRMLGFETLHDGRISDAEIRRLAREEGRIVLSRDRELLKCRDIARGCYVRSLKPDAQLEEVAHRYGLAPRARPFTLCLHCNLPLQSVDRLAVAERVPPGVLERHERFTRCGGCGRIYWPGTHYERMRERLGISLFRAVVFATPKGR